MRFSGVSANAIWNNAVRTLSGFGPSIGFPNAGQTSIAAASSVDLVQPSNTLADITITVKTGSAPTAAISINLYDGANVHQIVITTVATNVTAAFNVRCGSAVRARLTNADASVAGTYMYNGIAWKQ